MPFITIPDAIDLPELEPCCCSSYCACTSHLTARDLAPSPFERAVRTAAVFGSVGFDEATGNAAATTATTGAAARDG